MTLDDILSADDVATELGVNRETAKRYMQSGLLKGKKVGPAWVTTSEEIKTFRYPEIGRPRKIKRKNRW